MAADSLVTVVSVGGTWLLDRPKAGEFGKGKSDPLKHCEPPSSDCRHSAVVLPITFCHPRLYFSISTGGNGMACWSGDSREMHSHVDQLSSTNLALVK